MNFKTNLRSAAAMALFFAVTDVLMLVLFGCLILHGTPFTGLTVAGGEASALCFRWTDYLLNCTLPCLLEDGIITVIYALCRWRFGSAKTDPFYFWLTHIALKLLLNLHSTAMFLCVLTYSRVSKWAQFLLGADDYLLPENCFALQRNSLLLALAVLVIAFTVFLHYPKWGAHPFRWAALMGASVLCFLLCSGSDSVNLFWCALVLAVCIGLPLVLDRMTAGKLDLSAWVDRRLKISFGSYRGKRDLYRISGWMLTGFLLLTVAWLAAGIAFGKANRNSLFGIQYSALLKIFAPLQLTINLMLAELQRRDPERYRLHHENTYALNSLVTILFGCGALFLMNEFGSVVCILALTVVMFLIRVDFREFAGDMPFSDKLWQVLLKVFRSALLGAALSVGLLLIENTVLHKLLLKFCGENLGGMLGSLPLYRGLVLHVGWVCLAVLLLFLAVLLAACGRSVYLSLRSRSSTVAEILRDGRIFLLNQLHKRTGDLTIARMVRPKQKAAAVPHSRFSVCTVILIVSVSVIGFNFAFHGYGGMTVLQSYYMKAGNFSTAYEITENITAERAGEVYALDNGTAETVTPQPILEAAVWQQVQAVLDADKDDAEIRQLTEIVTPVPTLDELEALYHTEVYRDPVSLKIMRIIDRLCYSVRTAELSAVQKGMKRNMGFDIGRAMAHLGYISSLQRKYYVTEDDIQNAPAETRSIYLDEKGAWRSGFRLEPNSEAGFVQCLTPADQEILVEFADRSTRRITVQVSRWERIFKSAEPVTAASDYVLYTLSRLGVGNMLLLVFVPFFFILLLLYQANTKLTLTGTDRRSCLRYLLHSVSILYVISFLLQTMVILLGVFGVWLFSGLSLPLVAHSNGEMLLNCICCGAMLAAVGDPYDHE